MALENSKTTNCEPYLSFLYIDSNAVFLLEKFRSPKAIMTKSKLLSLNGKFSAFALI